VDRRTVLVPSPYAETSKTWGVFATPALMRAKL
jgi:hypothetical protein